MTRLSDNTLGNLVNVDHPVLTVLRKALINETRYYLYEQADRLTGDGVINRLVVCGSSSFDTPSRTPNDIDLLIDCPRDKAAIADTRFNRLMEEIGEHASFDVRRMNPERAGASFQQSIKAAGLQRYYLYRSFHREDVEQLIQYRDFYRLEDRDIEILRHAFDPAVLDEIQGNRSTALTQPQERKEYTGGTGADRTVIDAIAMVETSTLIKPFMDVQTFPNSNALTYISRQEAAASKFQYVFSRSRQQTKPDLEQMAQDLFDLYLLTSDSTPPSPTRLGVEPDYFAIPVRDPDFLSLCRINIVLTDDYTEKPQHPPLRTPISVNPEDLVPSLLRLQQRGQVQFDPRRVDALASALLDRANKVYSASFIDINDDVRAACDGLAQACQGIKLRWPVKLEPSVSQLLQHASDNLAANTPHIVSKLSGHMHSTARSYALY